MNGVISDESSQFDLYATLVLSNMLDTEHDINEKKEEGSHPTLQEDVMWVPADKHPEIAPNEFANFIKTHGADTPVRKAFSLHRRKSILSQSLISSGLPVDDDDAQLNRSLSEKKRIFLKNVMAENQQLKDKTNKKTQVFDPNSTANDDSCVIAPKKHRSLLRRSAFSARGPSRKANGTAAEDRQQATKRRSVSERKPSSSTTSCLNDNDIASVKSQATQSSWDKSEGVSLFDQPVHMSEWIDLGSASLESDDSQRGILSRVHDAESILMSHHLADVVASDDKNERVQHGESAKSPQLPTKASSLADEDVKVQETSAADMTRIAPKVKLEALERPDIIRSEAETNKSERRSSWLSGFFNDKKNGKSKGKKEPLSVTVINNTALSPLSGFASLLGRSLSKKHSNTSSSQLGRIKSKNKIDHTNSTNTITSINNAHTLHTTMMDTTKPTSITLPPIITILDNDNDNNNNNNNNNDKKKRSSRLEIPPPSERTFFNSSRLPLHVERAIYRLSHMKLADPRRQLQQQVLISNLMFWYLSIQQNDFQHVAEQRIELESPPKPDTQRKKGNKMSRLFLSAKKRRNEAVQFVQLGTHHDISLSTTTTAVSSPAWSSSSSSSSSSTTSSSSSSSSSSASIYALSIASSTTTRPSLKPSNVQFCLPPIPTHHHTINFHGEHDEEEEDDLPLSHFKS